jgi:hypothetical protein
MISDNTHDKVSLTFYYLFMFLSRFCSQRGLRIGPIQRMGAAPGVIHTERFFVLIPLEVVGKINGGER